MTTRLIIGYGNVLCGDDALGVIAAERLEALLKEAPFPVRVITAHQLLPEHAVDVAEAGSVLFIDAAAEGIPGEVRLEVVTPEALGVYAGHTLTPGALIGMAQTLYGASPPAWLAALTGEAFDLGAPLSQTVRDVLPDLIALCLQHLHNTG